MNKQLEIVQIIKTEEGLMEGLIAIKMTAYTIGQERQALLDMEIKKAYIKGLKDALLIIQKK
jgi:hypothetical protein